MGVIVSGSKIDRLETSPLPYAPAFITGRIFCQKTRLPFMRFAHPVRLYECFLPVYCHNILLTP